MRLRKMVRLLGTGIASMAGMLFLGANLPRLRVTQSLFASRKLVQLLVGMSAFMVVRKGTLVVTGSLGDGISMSGGCK
jgi:hypothetical protein